MLAPLVNENGVLAQLGARNIRNVEATGSNPVYSMKRKCRKTEGFLVKSMVLRHFYCVEVLRGMEYNFCKGCAALILHTENCSILSSVNLTGEVRFNLFLNVKSLV